MKAPVGLLSGRAVLRSKMEGHCPDKLGGICNKGYHGLQGASRWFCKIYCNKAVIVGLIGDKLSKKYQILVDRRIVGLSMMCYTEEAEVLFLYLARYSFGESQPKGRIGKRLYLYYRCSTSPRCRCCRAGLFDTSPVAEKVYKNSENRRKQGVSCGFRCICRCSICPVRAQPWCARC